MIYALIDILLWIVRGWWQYFVLDHGLPSWLKLAEGTTAPAFWRDYYSQWQWEYYLDDNGKPTHLIWASRYRTCATRAFNAWVGVQTRAARDAAISAINAALGSLLHGYTTFSAWIETIWNRVGTAMPWWTVNVVSGLSKLYYWLPSAIRSATSTWDDIWDAIKTAVKEWAKARFDAAIAWLNNTISWLTTGYNTVRAWYDIVATWVTNFYNNPIGTVVGWLGAAWTFLTGAWTGLKDFYNNVWVPFKVSLHDFFDHPVLWLYDRFDEEADNYIEILSRWVGKIAEKIIEWGWNYG